MDDIGGGGKYNFRLMFFKTITVENINSLFIKKYTSDFTNHLILLLIIITNELDLSLILN